MFRWLRLVVLLSLLLPAASYAQRRWTPPHPHRPRAGRLHRIRVHSKKVFRNDPNVFSLNQGIGVFDGEAAIGIGVEYERFIDSKHSFSVSIPLTYYAAGSFASGGSQDYIVRMSGIYTAPGIRYHPLSPNQKADIGIGLAFGVGSYVRDISYSTSYSGRNREADYSGTFTALLGQFNVNFRSARHFMLGLHFSGGPMFPSGRDVAMLVQAGVKFGWGFN